ncbi:MAG: ABC transporter ATP-binding protein [Chloroflexota bacterium]
MPNNSLLTINNLNVFYGSAQVLHNITLDIGAEPVSIVGRNGMGKTTLCNAIMGLVPAASGQIQFGDIALVGRRPFQIARSGIGYVPQGRRIFPSLTVDEHLKMLNSNPTKGTQWTIDRIYEIFPRLFERRTSGAGKLSGGEQQMLAIGRALLLNAKLLIMDEPSEGLAPVIVDQLVEVLKQLSQGDIGLLVIEQKLAVAAELAERMLVMVNGQIALETTAAKLLTDEGAQRRYLGVSPLEN